MAWQLLSQLAAAAPGRPRADLRRQGAQRPSRPRLMAFTVIDLIILIAIGFAIGSGYRRGFWLSLAQYAGLVLGVIVGAALAPVLMDTLQISASTARSLGAVLILIVLGAIGSSLGYW